MGVFFKHEKKKRPLFDLDEDSNRKRLSNRLYNSEEFNDELDDFSVTRLTIVEGKFWAVRWIFMRYLWYILFLLGLILSEAFWILLLFDTLYIFCATYRLVEQEVKPEAFPEDYKDEFDLVDLGDDYDHDNIFSSEDTLSIYTVWLYYSNYQLEPYEHDYYNDFVLKFYDYFEYGCSNLCHRKYMFESSDIKEFKYCVTAFDKEIYDGLEKSEEYQLNVYWWNLLYEMIDIAEDYKRLSELYFYLLEERGLLNEKYYELRRKKIEQIYINRFLISFDGLDYFLVIRGYYSIVNLIAVNKKFNDVEESFCINNNINYFYPLYIMQGDMVWISYLETLIEPTLYKNQIYLN